MTAGKTLRLLTANSAEALAHQAKTRIGRLQACPDHLSDMAPRPAGNIMPEPAPNPSHFYQGSQFLRSQLPPTCGRVGMQVLIKLAWSHCALQPLNGPACSCFEAIHELPSHEVASNCFCVSQALGMLSLSREAVPWGWRQRCESSPSRRVVDTQENAAQTVAANLQGRSRGTQRCFF